MPYKRTYKKKSTYRRKSKTSSSYTARATGPLTLVRKLRYSTQTNINPGAAGIAANVFIKANGLFDVEVAAGGHQPLGFDQYMDMYDHFKVLSSKISVQFLQVGNDTASQAIVAITLDDDTTANTSIDNMIEQGLSTWKVIQGSQAASKPTTLTKTFSSSKFFSNRKSAADLLGTVAADPVEGAFFNISAAGLDSTDPNLTKMLIVIDYIVSFSERRTLGSS